MKSKKEPITGAIQKAVRLRNKAERDDQLVEKARLDLLVYGIRSNYYIHDVKIPINFLARVENNAELLCAILDARKLNIAVNLKEKFDLGVGNVSVDASASDEEIIKFLMK